MQVPYHIGIWPHCIALLLRCHLLQFHRGKSAILFEEKEDSSRHDLADDASFVNFRS